MNIISTRIVVKKRKIRNTGNLNNFMNFSTMRSRTKVLRTEKAKDKS